MLVLVPQALIDTPYREEKAALKIVSRIVCGNLRECQKFRSRNELQGPPQARQSIFGDWINIDGNSLKAICGAYNQVCENLERDEFIERNHRYSNFHTKFPKSFRLHSNCWASPLVLHSVQQRLSRINFHSVVGDAGGELNEEYRAAQDHLGCFKLPEDQVERLNAICNATRWPDNAKRNVADLYGATWWSTVDRNGRYNTPYTCLPKGIRSELRCEGERVVGFDFKNFQPALLTLYRQTGISLTVPWQEQALYFQLCAEGKLYEYLAQHFPRQPSRHSAKKAFNVMLNQANAKMKEMTVFHIFDQHFPTYSQIIQEIKRTDHTTMARFLQGTEVEVMFGGVVRSFRAKTKAPFFTVHDAIYTTESHALLLREVLQKQIELWNIPTAVGEEGEHTTQTTPPPTNVGMKSRCGRVYPQSTSL
jgi:hypothetical protein